jgi:Flp pilus assembly protein TadG
MNAHAILRRLAAFAGRFHADERGVSAVLVALMATSLIGAVALGVEASLWYKVHADIQSAADTAALSAAAAVKAGESATLVDNEAWAGARSNGFAITSISGAVGSGPNGLTVTVNSPPATGGYMANGSAVQVIISDPQSLILAGLFMKNGPTISASAVAGTGNGSACVLVLNPNSSAAVSVSGGALTLNKCNLQVNSTSATALNMPGGSIVASAVDIVGNYHSTGGSMSPSPTIGATAVADPYSGLFAANSVSTLTSGACPAANNAVSVSAGAKTLSQGVYCNGLSVSGGSLTLNPGVYILQGGAFNVSAGTVTGTGVTIILTCGAPPCTNGSGSWASVDLSGGTMNLSAPTSGAWSGMLLYQDPTNTAQVGPQSAPDTIAGGGATLSGALYFPAQAVNYSGGLAGGQCNQLIAYTVTFSGGGSLYNSNCAAAGVKAIDSQGGGSLQLLE